MGCCGQGRAALRAAAPSITARPPPTHGPPAAAVLRYLGGKHVRMRGTVSGRLYEFTRGKQTVVEARDVPMMVRTGLFARH